MRDPGEAFYRQVVNSGLEYAAARWEWSATVDRLARESCEGRVLDLGCGVGAFLDELGRLPGVQGIGLDLNPDVVAACRARGHLAFVGDAMTIPPGAEGPFQAITLWHVVEHVAAPVPLLMALAQRLAPGGQIFFSVPLTPMSTEHAWIDPFNLPPHHLTRWNLRSLTALAKATGLRMEFELPRADSLFTRWLRALVRQAMPVAGAGGKAAKARRLAAYLLRHPFAPFGEAWRQWRHPRHRGAVLPDVVLVAFSR